MAKCWVQNCQDEAMEGSEVCKKHFLEDIHRILDKARRKREREQRIAKGKRDA